MKNVIKKIIRYILLGVFIWFIVFIISSIILARFFVFKKVDAFLPNVHYPIKYLKRDAYSKTRIMQFYTSKFGDSVYIFNYADSFNVAIWIIEQNAQIYLMDKVDTNQIKFDQENFFFPYERLFLPGISIRRRLFKHYLNNISVRFSNCKSIQQINNNIICHSFHLKAGAIYLILGDDNYYDAFIGLNNYRFSDFMISHLKDKLYLVAIYSPNNRYDITPGALNNIVNIPSNEK
jgi:hypothetical protein